MFFLRFSRLKLFKFDVFMSTCREQNFLTLCWCSGKLFKSTGLDHRERNVRWVRFIGHSKRVNVISPRTYVCIFGIRGRFWIVRSLTCYNIQNEIALTLDLQGNSSSSSAVGGGLTPSTPRFWTVICC